MFSKAKSFKKALAVLSAALLMSTTLAVVPVTASTNVAAASVSTTRGTTGDCTWKIENDTLTISGKGDMEAYYSPWRDKAFSKVVIENSVKNVADSAFSGCTNLKTVTIGNSVEKIGYNAFCDCRALTSVTIGNSVQNIDCYAFFGCANLKFVTIPKSVKYIADSAFGYYYDGGSKKVDLTIVGSKGSVAETYAKENSLKFVVAGDVNGDGEVSIKDATMIQYYLAKLKTLNKTQLKAADINNDGKVSIADVTKIQYILAGLE